MQTQETPRRKSPMNGDVPAEPFVQLLEQEIARLDQEAAESSIGIGMSGGMTGRQRIVELVWDGSEGGMRRLYTLLNRKQEMLTFDVADRILCRLDRVELWQTDPVLCQVYEQTDLRALDAARPTTESVAERLRAELAACFAEKRETLPHWRALAAVVAEKGVSRRAVELAIGQAA